MSDQDKSSVTPEEKIVSHARIWRATEKQAIAAPEGQKAEARRVHRYAVRNLREAVDLVERKS